MHESPDPIESANSSTASAKPRRRPGRGFAIFSGWELPILATTLGMESCLWLALVDAFQRTLPSWILFGIPFICAVATRAGWSGIIMLVVALNVLFGPGKKFLDPYDLIVVLLAVRGVYIGFRFTTTLKTWLWIGAGTAAFLLIGDLVWHARHSVDELRLLLSYFGVYIVTGLVTILFFLRAASDPEHPLPGPLT